MSRDLCKSTNFAEGSSPGWPKQDIKLVDKYLKLVIPAKAGIQRYYWMPDQVRHDQYRLLSRQVNNYVCGNLSNRKLVVNKNKRFHIPSCIMNQGPWINMKIINGFCD